MAYITTREARDRLRIEEAYAEEDLARMIGEAEDIVADYLKLLTNYAVDDVPPRVRTATLLVIQALYDGDEQPLSTAVRSLLHRLRDPALA